VVVVEVVEHSVALEVLVVRDESVLLLVVHPLEVEVEAESLLLVTSLEVLLELQMVDS